MLVMGAAPILAPTLGSAVLRWTDWRGVFVVLAVLGSLLIVVALAGLPETLPASRRRRSGLAGSGRVYAGLLRDRSFVGLVLVAGFAMAALFAYISGSSFVFQDRYGLTEQQFGLVFGAGALGLIAATQLNVVLLRRFEPARILGGCARRRHRGSRRPCRLRRHRIRGPGRHRRRALGGAGLGGVGHAERARAGAVAPRRGRRDRLRRARIGPVRGRRAGRSAGRRARHRPRRHGRGRRRRHGRRHGDLRFVVRPHAAVRPRRHVGRRRADTSGASTVD
jgi:MFS family permease